MANDIEVHGLQEVQKALYSYSTKLGDYVVYKALRAGANLVKKQIEKNAPTKTGVLRRGFRVIKSKINNGRNKPTIGIYVTLKKTVGKSKSDPFYGRFQELGWNTHGKVVGGRRGITSVFGTRTSRKTQRGKTNVQGKYFIDKAFESSKGQAASLIVALASEGANMLAKKEGLQNG